jgi:hypothetical protein
LGLLAEGEVFPQLGSGAGIRKDLGLSQRRSQRGQALQDPEVDHPEVDHPERVGTSDLDGDVAPLVPYQVIPSRRHVASKCRPEQTRNRAMEGVVFGKIESVLG